MDKCDCSGEASTYTPRHIIPVAPAEILQDEIDERGWTYKELARRMERDEKAVERIIVDKLRLTPLFALALGRALGTSAELWMTLESNYRLGLAREDEKERKENIGESVND